VPPSHQPPSAAMPAEPAKTEIRANSYGIQRDPENSISRLMSPSVERRRCWMYSRLLTIARFYSRFLFLLFA
jgi:hypothetical protein